MVPLELCGAKPTDVLPAEYYIRQLWNALDKTAEHSGRGVGSHLPEGSGGALDPVTLKIRGAAAPKNEQEKESIPCATANPPPPPPLLPEMRDELAVTNSIRALSLQIIAVHGPTGTGKSTVFPLSVAHWTHTTAGVKSRLTACAQPGRILARELCNCVRENQRMKDTDKSVGYVIARESSKDNSSKILYCMEAVVALMMQSHQGNATYAHKKEEITTVIVDEVHNRSAQSDYVLALTSAAMQKSSRLRLVLMSTTRDHKLVQERIPYCQKLVMKGATQCVRRYFLSQPIEHTHHLLFVIAQVT